MLQNNQSKHSSEFVRRVNEVFHDIEAESYTSEHPEIFELEKARWQKLAQKFFTSRQPLTILDVGSGTGFVPLQLAKVLKPSDKIICSDISQKILDVCRKNINQEKFKCQFEYLKIGGENLPVKDQSMDMLTVNSVLHHLPDTKKFFLEADRVLKNGGLLVVAHEPNQEFFEHKFLWFNYRLGRVLINPRFLAEAVLKRLGLQSVYEKYLRDKKRYTDNLKKINQRLIEQGLISEPLSPWQLGKIVDFHSAQGFSVKKILKEYLPGYQIIFLESYNQLYRVYWCHHNNVILKLYNKLLGKLFPKLGATFTVIFQKYG